MDEHNSMFSPKCGIGEGRFQEWVSDTKFSTSGPEVISPRGGDAGNLSQS